MSSSYTLVICATPREYEALRAVFSDWKDVEIAGVKGIEFTIGERSVLGVRGDIGKAATSLTIGRLSSALKIDEIIGTGVAGALSETVAPLDIVLADRVAFYDIDLTPFGNQLGQLDGDPRWYEASRKNIGLISSMTGITERPVHVGSIVSGDRFVSSGSFDERLIDEFENPLAVDMESAAVGMCAHRLGIPFTIIRSISDSTNSKANKDTYEANARTAAAESIEIVKKLLIG